MVPWSVVLFILRYYVAHFEVMHTTEGDYETFKTLSSGSVNFFKNQETFSQTIALIAILLKSFSTIFEGDWIYSLS